MSRDLLATGLALLLVIAAVGTGVQPAAGASSVQTPDDVFTDAVTSNTGWLGGWAPSDDVPVTGEGNPYWVVQYTNNSSSDLEAWANASSSRTIRAHHKDSRLMTISAPVGAVGAGHWRPFVTPLRQQSYVEKIGVRRTISVDPIFTPDLKDKSDWSAPDGGFMATYGGYKGSFDADGAAWGEEVNTSSLEDARQAIGADQVDVNGSGVRVAILDTGLDYNESLYGDRVVDGYNSLTEETLNTSKSAENRSYAAVADGSSSNHGSWVATAIGGNGTGANATGVAPGASLIPVKVLGDDGSGSTTDIAEGLEWACDDANADVVSMSLGSPLSSVEINKEIEECLEDDGVSAVVVAAGNNRMTTRYVQSPGDSDQVVTVAATDSRDVNESESAYFSAVGPDPSTEVSPEVGAPGMKISADVADGPETLSGTSMATPLVSGTTALLLEARPDLEGEHRDVRDELASHAETLPNAGETEVGAGRVDVEATVDNGAVDNTTVSESAASRDTANRALSGSVWRGFGVPSVSLPSLSIAAKPLATGGA